MSMMVLDDDKPAVQPLPNTKISEAIVRLHRRGASSHLTQLLSKLKPKDIADILGGFPEHKANELFSYLSPPTHAAQVLGEMDGSHKKYVLTHCTVVQAVAILKCMPADVSRRIISELGDVDGKRLLEAMTQEEEQELAKKTTAYAEDTAGSLMETNILALPESTTAAAAIQAVQGMSAHDAIFYLYVWDEEKHLTGVCSLRRLILADPDKTLKEFTSSRLIKVHVDTPQGVVANQISRYRLLAMPVVDDMGVLVGQITIDNLVHIIQEENTFSLMKMAGIGSKDTNILSQSPFYIFRTRVPWLITAFVAYLLVSAILEGFEETLAAVVQLAFFFPIVIGMSGNAGSQTGAVVVRGLALGTIHNAHFFKLLFKELAANFVQGGFYGLCLAVASYAIFQNSTLSMTLGIAMSLSITFSAAIAMSLPFFFKKMGADPAVAAGPLALAFIDMVGSINYLTVAFLMFKL